VKLKKSLLRRLPVLRGKDKFKSLKGAPLIVNLKMLNVLKEGTVVDIDSLAKAGIVKLDDAKEVGVKILGDGELEKKLVVKLSASKSATEKIIKAGGKIE
jgi:large subunit ribosomal protein L15